MLIYDELSRCRDGVIFALHFGLACNTWGYTTAYGPGINIFVDQIRPFIHMYFRRTILSDSNPVKSSLSRGDIFNSKKIDFKA